MTKLIEEQGSGKVGPPSPRRPSGRSPKQESDRSTQPQLFAPTEIVAEANKWVNTLKPRLKAVTGFDVPREFVVAMGDMNQMDEAGALAWSFPGGIELNPNGFQGMTSEQIGSVMAHEMTHQILEDAALMGDRDEGSYMLFTEGLADYVKDQIFQRSGGSIGGSLSGYSGVQDPDFDYEKYFSPKAGYQTGAAFFQWLEKKKPGTVKAVIASLKAGDETPLVSTTGRPLRDLLTQYTSETEITQHDVDYSKQVYHRQMAASNQTYNGIWKAYRTGEISWQDYMNQMRDFSNKPSPDPPFSYVGRPIDSAGLGEAPAPERLGPHYAAGPNPGLSAIYHPEDHDSSVPGVLDIPTNLYGMEPLPMADQPSAMAPPAAAPQTEYKRGSGPDALPWGEAAQVNDSVGLIPPTEEDDFTPQGDQEQYLFSPTDRVDEPATTGLPYGDGSNYSPHVEESDDDLVRRVAMAAKNDPTAPKQMRQFAERALNGM